MEALDLSIKNCLGTASIKENDEDEGVFIEETVMYEELNDYDAENTEPIEEEALIPDGEDFESTNAFDQYILSSVMPLKDDSFARTLVTSWKQD